MLRAPIDEATIRSLKVGDVVLVLGQRAVELRAAARHRRRRARRASPVPSGTRRQQAGDSIDQRVAERAERLGVQRQRSVAR